MKRLPIHSSNEPRLGDDVWYQTEAELAGSPEVASKRVREFQDNGFAVPDGVDRRTFLSLMGASMALGGLATGCRRPEELILPYTKRPEDLVDGETTYYATSVALYGTALGLLVESADGRPIKIEGNPAHSASLGGTTALAQAVVLDMYDPDRSKNPRQAGKDASTADAWTALGAVAADLRSRQGRGLAVLIEEHRSPTTAAALEAMLRDMPQARIFRYEAFGREMQRTGVLAAHGEAKDVSLSLDKADVVVVLDGDILNNESSPVRNSKGFAKRRRAEHGGMSRFYVAEACPSVTGMAADHRLRVQAREIVNVAKALASALSQAGVPVSAEVLTACGSPKLSETASKWVAACAKDLAEKKSSGLIVAGVRQPPAVHALVAALNHGLGAVDSTVRYLPQVDLVEGSLKGLEDLGAELKAGTSIDTLLILGGNPIFNAPAELGLEEGIKKAKVSIHLSTHVDETSQLCSWHIPRAHALESWSDTMADDGTFAITQPLIAPLYEGRTDAEVLEHLVGGNRTPHELVMATWGRILGAVDFDKKWRRALHDGFFVPQADGEAVLGKSPDLTVNGPAVAGLLNDTPPAAGDFEVVFTPDPHAYDGRFANSGWLMELPDPIHKATWGSYAALSHTTAQKLGLKNGDHLEIAVLSRSVELPIVITYGHADDSVSVPVGLGRRFEGRVCKGVGVDATPIRTRAGFHFAGCQVKKSAKNTTPAVTQGHFVMEGRPLIRTQTVAEHQQNPDWARNLVKHPPLLNLFADWEYNGHKWGMSIDLTLCTGCSACVTACQAENNIPVLGVEGVLKSREMHWLRIDRYFAGKHEVVEGLDDAHAANMPMTCQHCENAPCEQVCPVAATTHSPEGINEMTYNRCIGTKYCGNNCPYKVRRFNYFAYDKDIPETQKLVFNPDVTVRSRGVMEKCTFCVQRVNEAKIAAKNEKQPEERARIMRSLQSACMQACPTEAITFGDLNDAGARPDGRDPVAHLASLPRAYKMLQEINVRPRISYLARVRNPSPMLEADKPVAVDQAAKPGAH